MTRFSRKQIGKKGEEVASDFLRSKGYRPVIFNWAWSRGEVDLIFRQGRDIVFVEVKTRLDPNSDKLFNNIDSRKISKLKQSKDVYLRRFRLGAKLPTHRIDLIGVVLAREDLECLEIKHVISAI